MNAGMILSTARKQAGVTQVELARRACTQQSAISRLEAGRASPTVETLQKLAACLGAELVIEIRLG